MLDGVQFAPLVYSKCSGKKFCFNGSGVTGVVCLSSVSVISNMFQV